MGRWETESQETPQAGAEPPRGQVISGRGHCGAETDVVGGAQGWNRALEETVDFQLQ